MRKMEVSEMENIQGSAWWCHAFLSLTACGIGAWFAIATLGIGAEISALGCGGAIVYCQSIQQQ